MAIEKANKERISKICPTANDVPGIYFFVREEDGFKYCYVGQAKKLLTRLAQHLVGYQHIDLSLRSHKFYSDDNPCGWRIGIMEAPESQLDELEQKYIKMYAEKGYQMRNKTLGGQGKGKKSLDVEKSVGGYYKGLKQGYTNARKEIARLFDKHLNYSKKSDKPNKNQDKAMKKFEDFIDLSDLNKENKC